METLFYSLAFSAILYVAIKIYLRFLDEQFRLRSGSKPMADDPDDR